MDILSSIWLWLTGHWAAILAGFLVFCAVGVSVKTYTDSTETKKDDWLGNRLGWLAGLIRAILNAIPGIGGKK